jgi:predicted nucleotidyltransferase
LAALVNLGFRRAEGEQEHRLYYGAAEIDLIPYGVTKSSEEALVWPESGNTMNMTGFSDVFRYAVPTEVTPGITLPVAPLWLFAVLKVSAYLDRRFSRDLNDLIFVLENYESADKSTRRFDILGEEDVTYEVSGAFLVGRDIGCYASAQAITLVQQFLKEISNEYHQVINRILQGEGRTFSESRREAVFKLIKALRKGLA